MTMEIILLSLMFLAIIDSGYMGDKELKKGHENLYKMRTSHPFNISNFNKTLLEAYYLTDPYTKGHGKRMGERLEETKGRNLRQRVQYLIENMCAEWERLTGLHLKETHEIFDKIYSGTKIDGPDLESRLRDKLLENRPEYRKIDPEIIRSVIHDWYKSRKKVIAEEGRIRSREDQADLLYTYSQVQYGKGYAFDRLAEKWKRFHPDLSNFSKLTLMKKANDLSNTDHGFSQAEIKKAKERYESVFGVEFEKVIRERPITKAIVEEDKIQSRQDQADLLYTYYQVRFGEGHIFDRLADKWKQFHPYSRDQNKATLFRKVTKLSRAHSEFSSEEMRSAKLRYEKIFGSESEEERTADLLYLFNRYKRKELASEAFVRYWQALHPEFVSATKNALYKKADNFRRRKIELTLEEETAVELRLKAALAQKEQSHQETMFSERGKSPESVSPDQSGFHQEGRDWMVYAPPRHDNLQLTQEEQNDLEKWMNSGTIQQQPNPRYSPASFNFNSYSPIAFSPFPGETSHSHFGSYSHYPHNANPYHEHGSSSHSHYDPQTTNPNYKHGGSSLSHHDPHTSNSYYEQGSSSHSHDKPEP